MKQIVFLISIALFFCSCSSTYYYATISKAYDENKVVQEPYGDYFVRKDSFDIAYSFNGWDGPVKIAVLNKGNLPMFIDWTKSALVINGQSYPYLRENADIMASIEGGTISIPVGEGVRIGGFGGAIRGSVRIPQNATFVPPGAWESPVPLMLDNPDFSKISKQEFTQTELIDKNGKNYSGKGIDFSENNSPIKMGVYLTIYNDKGESQNIESRFYLSNLQKVKGLSPQNLPHTKAERGDLYFMQQMNYANYLLYAAGFFGTCGILFWAISPSDPEFNHSMPPPSSPPDWW